MHTYASTSATCLILLAACSSSSSGTGGAQGGGGGTGPTVNEHGKVYDYGTLLATGTLATVGGLTVTDGNQTTTTAADGTWSLQLPLGATLAPVVTGTSKGDPYSYLILPTATAAGTDLDWGNIITPDVSTFMLERLTLASTDTDAIVHIVAVTTGACTSLKGGTLTVTSPPGAKVNYFDMQGYPAAAQTSMVDPPVPQRPVADIYNMAPGTQFTFTVTHPTCHLAPYPVTINGGTFNGQVTTKAAEPGDNNSAVNLILE
jgi:hypothetical protein